MTMVVRPPCPRAASGVRAKTTVSVTIRATRRTTGTGNLGTIRPPQRFQDVEIEAARPPDDSRLLTAAASRRQVGDRRVLLSRAGAAPSCERPHPRLLSAGTDESRASFVKPRHRGTALS